MSNVSEITPQRIAAKIKTFLQSEYIALTEVEGNKIYVKFFDGQKYCITVTAETLQKNLQ